MFSVHFKQRRSAVLGDFTVLEDLSRSSALQIDKVPLFIPFLLLEESTVTISGGYYSMNFAIYNLTLVCIKKTLLLRVGMSN